MFDLPGYLFCPALVWISYEPSAHRGSESANVFSRQSLAATQRRPPMLMECSPGLFEFARKRTTLGQEAQSLCSVRTNVTIPSFFNRAQLGKPFLPVFLFG